MAKLIEMLRPEKGATADGIVAATRWLPHMVGEAIAGALKKRLGPDVTSEKVHGVGGSILPRARYALNVAGD